MAEDSQWSEFTVGEWTVRPRLNRVERNGHCVSLEPMAMALLVHLAERSDEVVTTDDLIARIWRGQIVSDSTVYQWVSRLRKALRDDFRAPRYIETIPKKGYRLVARVRVPKSKRVSSSETVRLPWIAPVAALALLISLATAAYLLQRETANALPAAMRLDESPTRNTRAMNFYLMAKDYEGLGRRGDEDSSRARVRQLVRAVQEDPDFALAWAALADASADHSEWNVGPAELRRLRIQAERAAETALGLAPNLAEAHIAAGRVHALEGRYRAALDAFAHAERLAPGNAWVYKQRAHTLRAIGDLEQAATNFERAIDLDPLDRQLYYVLGWSCYELLRDRARAAEVFDRLVEIAPDELGYAHGRKTNMLLRLDGNVSAYRRALENPRGTFHPGLDHWWRAAVYERDYETALRYLDESEEEDADKARLYGVTYHLAGMPELAKPQFELAHAESARAVDEKPEDPWRLASLGEILAYLGDRDAALDLARRAMELLPSSTDATTAHFVRLDVFWILVATEDYESAVEQLESYLERPGLWSIEGLQLDPRLNPIRNDPGFQALVRRYGRG